MKVDDRFHTFKAVGDKNNYGCFAFIEGIIGYKFKNNLGNINNYVDYVDLESGIVKRINGSCAVRFFKEKLIRNSVNVSCLKKKSFFKLDRNFYLGADCGYVKLNKNVYTKFQKENLLDKNGKCVSDRICVVNLSTGMVDYLYPLMEVKEIKFGGVIK